MTSRNDRFLKGGFSGLMIAAAILCGASAALGVEAGGEVRYLAAAGDDAADARAETVEKRLAFGGFRQMGYHGQKETAADIVSRGVVGGEDDDPFAGTAAQDLPQNAHLGPSGA